jgi:hypothetical protein
MNIQYNAQTSPPAIAGGVPLLAMTTEGDRPLHGYGSFTGIILSYSYKINNWKRNFYWENNFFLSFCLWN